MWKLLGIHSTIYNQPEMLNNILLSSLCNFNPMLVSMGLKLHKEDNGVMFINVYLYVYRPCFLLLIWLQPCRNIRANLPRHSDSRVTFVV